MPFHTLQPSKLRFAIIGQGTIASNSFLTSIVSACFCLSYSYTSLAMHEAYWELHGILEYLKDFMELRVMWRVWPAIFQMLRFHVTPSLRKGKEIITLEQAAVLGKRNVLVLCSPLKLLIGMVNTICRTSDLSWTMLLKIERERSLKCYFPQSLLIRK